MNRTESGAIAVGAPMSLGRMMQELEFLAAEGTVEGFSKTPEGEALIQKFIDIENCGATPEQLIQNLIHTPIISVRLKSYLDGARGAMQYAYVGRVYKSNRQLQ